MTERQAFSAQLQLLQQAEQQDLSNLFILHGIVHLYQGVFDLAMTVFRDALKRDGFGMSAMGSPKESLPRHMSSTSLSMNLCGWL